MAKLFSYVVDHDLGSGPNPYYGFCTLALCKYKKKRKNVIECAKEGDWVVGTGGESKRSTGNGTLIYAMKVDKILPLAKYWSDSRFKKKKRVEDGSPPRRLGDNLMSNSENWNRFVLISKRGNYYYFGSNAPKIPLNKFPNLEKKGPSWRADFSPEFIRRFERWLKRKYKPGVQGEPCGKGRISSIKVRRRKDCESSC